MKSFQSSWWLPFAFLLAGCSTTPATDTTPRVVVLHVSDLHARLSQTPGFGPGYARVAGVLNQQSQGWGEKTDVLRIFGGDAAGKGSMACRNSSEKLCFPLLKHFDFDFAVLGNWELKRSVAELRPLLESSGTTWIGSNVRATSGLSPWVKEFVYRGPRSGAEWKILSATAAPTPGEIDFKRAGFAVRRGGGGLPPHKSSPVLWVTHQELEEDQSLAQEFCRWDQAQHLAMLRAHTHVPKRLIETSCVPMMEAGAYGFAISKLVFENRSGQWELVSREFVDVTDSSPVDAAMQAAVDQVLLQAAPDASRILGQVREPMSREALAGWLSKAFLGVTRADLSISNLGAVKDPVGVGSLTLELLLSYILPYNDPLVGVDMSRMELEQALCKSSKRPRDSFEDNGSELFLSGARLVIEENGACRLEGLKKSQIKVAMPAFVAKRSARWIGLDLSRRSFAFGVDQNHAVLTALRVRPELP